MSTPSPSNSIAVYTAHATSAATIAGALAEIGAWGFSLVHIDVPGAIAVATTIVLTPVVSFIFKKVGILSD